MASNGQFVSKARTHVTSVFVLAVLLLLARATAAVAGTYYVDQGDSRASDSNSGTATSPWKTLLKATQTAVAGDVVVVKAGRYVDPASTWEAAFNPVNSGTAQAPIVFRSEPRLAAVVAPGDFPLNHSQAFGVENRNYIVIDGFKAEGQIQMLGCIGGTIQNCEVIYGSVEGDDLSLNWGLTLHTSSQMLVRNNYVHNMNNDGNNAHNTAGIMVFQSNNSVIENNDVDCGGGTVYASYGQKGGLITFNVWRRNIARNGVTGFLGMGSTDNTKLSSDNQFYSNIIINSSQSAFELDHATARFDIYNNVAYNSGAFVWAGYDDAANTAMRFWNNLVVGGKDGYHRETGATVDWHALVASSDHNNFNTPKVAVWNWGGSSYTTLATWTPATLFDPLSLSINPGFVNAAGGDFHLSTTSLCRGVGLNGVDLGAYPTRTETIGPDFQPLPPGDVATPSAVTDLRAR